MHYMDKENISTHYNSNDVLPDDILTEQNTVKGFSDVNTINNNHIMEEDNNFLKRRPSRISSFYENEYKDEDSMELLKRNTIYEIQKEGERTKHANNKNMEDRNSKNNIYPYGSRISANIRRNSIYGEQNEKIASDIATPYSHYTDTYGKPNSFVNNDVMRDKRNDDLQTPYDVPAADIMSAYNSIYGTNPSSKNNTTRFFSNGNVAPKTKTNSFLENVDKAEQKLVTNHLKNSLTHNNETAARRMSSILLNPNNHKKETLASPSYDASELSINRNRINSDSSVRKYSTNDIKYYADNMSINKYSTASDQLNHYNADSNNDSSVILSSVNNRGTNMENDSFKKMNELDSINYMKRDRFHFPKEMNSNFPSNFGNLETNSNLTNVNVMRNANASNNNNNNVLPNIENFNTVTKQHSKLGNTISPHIYAKTYSRALDINDLNSNTSKNYVNSANSLKSECVSRNIYSKMFERPKSLTSQINKPIMTYKYLKANI